jgi:glycosyltransferase involved in cell wall biosynthesis
MDYSPFDLIHFFNITRPADILYHIRQSGKPYVISTIFVDYSEFDRRARKGASGLLFKILPSPWMEYAKVIARSLVNREKIMSREYLWLGQTKAIRKVIRGSRLLLPNSHHEYQRLSEQFVLEHPYEVIPNAIDPQIFSKRQYVDKEKMMVLCVGRVEGLKNQLNPVRAMNGTRFLLFIIGEPATNHTAYYEQCKREAGTNIHFLKRMTQADLSMYYGQARVHVLPSWFETTGLSSLEAAAMGCNIVITDKGDTREYFEDMAFYCDPESPASIRSAVEAASAAPVNPELKQKILQQYNWSVTAEKTAAAYARALSQSSL